MEILANTKSVSQPSDTIRTNRLVDAGETDGSNLKTHLVTAVKPAVKNEHRVNVFIDEKYSFSLNLAQIVDYKIKVGQRLDVEQIEQYKKLSEFGKLYQRTLEWVLARPRSERETRDYLKRKKIRREMENRRRTGRREYLKNNPDKRRVQVQKYRDADGFCHEREKHESLKKLPEFDDQDIDEVLKKLIEKQYVDDQKFAEYYVENRMIKKGISQRRLRQELFKKGVSAPVIEQVLADSNRNDIDEIKKIIQKKRAKYSDEKLIQYLTRQGFDYQTVKNLVCETD